MSHARTAAALSAALMLAACAETQSPNALANNDPYETTNRRIFAFDVQYDHMVLEPSAKAYNDFVPDGVRQGAHNFISNLDLPITFANDVLQGEPGRAGRTVARFTVNSTLGVAGVFDMAGHMGIPAHTEDFGVTLGKWGVGEGPYVVLPLLGPDPPRDIAGLAGDFAFDPTVYVHLKQHIWWALGREYLTVMDTRARNLDTLNDIERVSLDYYATTRSLYRQLRDNEIRDGKPPREN
jgi:phospholipid-binding lipoprotein MlaA